MSLQRILNVCQTVSIDRRKVIGIQYTRSEIAKITETPTRNPWRISLSIGAALLYNQNRDLLEEIDRLDSRLPETISFSSNPNLSFMLAYQGDAKANVANITVTSFSGTTLTLGNLPAISGSVSANTVLFKKGDYIQIKTFPYPFTATADVLRGSGTTVAVTTHRPNFITENGTQTIVGKGINVGNDVQFRMFCPSMPTYKLVSAIKNNPMIVWSGDFQLTEYTGEVV